MLPFPDFSELFELLEVEALRLVIIVIKVKI